MSQSAPPGLDCPKCQSRIPMSMELLIRGKPFYCGGCGLKIEVDHKKSKSALDKLSILKKKLKEADDMVKNVLK